MIKEKRKFDKSSILNNQKLNRKSLYKSRLAKTTKTALLITFFVVPVAIAGYYLINNMAMITKIFDKKNHSDIVIHLNKHSLQKVPLDVQKQISLLIKNELIKNTYIELKGIAKKIGRKFAFEFVNIFKISPYKLFVTFNVRRPILCVKTKKLRFLTKNGIIYGHASKKDTKNLTTITGIFPDNALPLRQREDGSIILTDKQTKLITEAISLHNYAKKNNIIFSSIEFILYRGFVGMIKGTTTKVVLGRAPFDKGIDRLVNILVKLRKKGTTAKQIELDYNGKAFIIEQTKI